MQVIQQGSEGANVKHAQPGPILRAQARKDGKDSRFRLTTRGWRKEQAMLAALNRLNTILLERPQHAPTERVGDVELN